MDTNISITNLKERLDTAKDQIEADGIIDKLLMAELLDAIKKIPRNM